MRTGLLVDDLTASQIAYEALRATANTPTFLFTSVFSKACIDPQCVVMDVSEIWDFNRGNLIATSFDTAMFVAKATNNSHKFYYVYDLDFPRDLYTNPAEYGIVLRKLGLIARSKFHADKIYQLLGVKVIGLCPTINIEILNEICLASNI